MPKNSAREAVDNLIDLGIHATRTVISETLDAVARDPETYLNRQINARSGKPALYVDLSAEYTFDRIVHSFRKKTFLQSEFFGEERLVKEGLDLSQRPGIVVLVDAVDGTDLLERGFGNWCCASVFFEPAAAPGSRILAAFVGVPGGEVYYATRGDGLFVSRGKERVRARGTSGCKSITSASISFYGQKTANLLTMFKRFRFASIKRPSDVRIYNLAGIPVIARMLDHVAPGVRGIDVVLDVAGQQPHDAVPGLFLAKKGAAAVRSLDGREISYEELEDALLKPAHARLTYIVAATEELAKEVVGLIRKEPVKSAHPPKRTAAPHPVA